MTEVELPKPNISNGYKIDSALENTILGIVREEIANAMEDLKSNVIQTIVNLIGGKIDDDMKEIWTSINEALTQIELNNEGLIKTRTMIKFHDHVQGSRNTEGT